MFRAGKKDPAPGPFYLVADIPYCRACGRVVSSKARDTRVQANSHRPDAPKYCSAQCKRKKPGPADRFIEQVFIAVLDGDESLVDLRSPDAQARLRALIADTKGKKRKGDPRVKVSCSEVQAILSLDSLEENSRTEGEGTTELSDDVNQVVEDDDDPDSENGQFMLDVEARQQEGMRIAEHKEMVKRAARRLVAFGYSPTKRIEDHENRSVDENGATTPARLCEVVSGGGKVVEPSFAKGNWSIRWRDE